ncbi:cytochrome ubiquinol oxidase subunit I [Isoptericola sp. NEAU-Y5]|uniref:Cytochrome ubiquinol oxidase subunit I n=1 Tax=Isoptericola luteus TaxID=2879484 RepID=A0ABS7ZIW5_9MICO|nr:cytochrome ubiquinol oxidase subunit I [Isoptericola sp. NEAU-Y5]MCA5894457.1 cytochrome ubiquinol oxidase subunit I [Isoptericola sp. NEAU-Y5]
MTTVDAARLQFALLAGTHFLFVLVTLGLGPVVAVFQSRWALARTPERRALFERATRFWGQLYLVNYALGVAAGIVMELQLGLNFPGLLEVAGGVFGAPLVIETMAAFFLESTFLGLWVFGWHVLPRWAHTAAIWAVVATGYLSAFTVMVANGFLRHPVGFEMVPVPGGAGPAGGEIARLTDAAALITNPAAVLSSLHVVGACLMAGAYVLVGVSAWHLRRVPSRLPAVEAAGLPGTTMSPENELWRRSLRTGVVTGTFGAFLATGSGFAQFTYFDAGESVTHAPWLIGPAYLLMQAVALLTFLVGVALMLLFARDGLFRMWRPVRRGLYGTLVVLLPVPFVTSLLGWVARETGRQPWAITGVLRTEDAVTDAPAGQVIASLVVLMGVMTVLAVADWVVMGRLARRGPERLALGSPPADALRMDVPHADLHADPHEGPSGSAALLTADRDAVLTFGGTR